MIGTGIGAVVLPPLATLAVGLWLGRGMAFACLLAAVAFAFLRIPDSLYMLIAVGLDVLAFGAVAWTVAERQRKEREQEALETQQWAWASKFDSQPVNDDIAPKS